MALGMDAWPNEGPERGRHGERFWSRRAPLPRVHVVALGPKEQFGQLGWGRWRGGYRLVFLPEESTDKAGLV